jgi:hypothetical protein
LSGIIDVFDRSKKTLFSAAEGGSGEDSPPRFQPLPGGFGKRQTPIADQVAQDAAAPNAAAHPMVSRDAERRDSVPGNESSNRGAQESKAAPKVSLDDARDDPRDNSLGLVAIGGGLATFGNGLKPGPDHVPTRLDHWLNKEFRHVRDVPCETTLTVIGALAGFAAQQGIWEALVKPGKMAIQEAFVVIETRTGETFFFGDFLNTILASPKPGHLSVWKIVGGAARVMGAADLPDITPIFKHCAETAGTASFGLPRLPDGHLPTILPRDAVNRYWPEARRILGGSPDPLAWALDAASAAQQLMLGMKDRIDPVLAAQVVMEAAIPMSRIDPMTVPMV